MFTAVSIRAASAYKLVEMETSVAAADPHELITLLFDALLKSLAHAKGAMLRKDIPTKGRAIGQAVSILHQGLRSGLDEEHGGDLAQRLYDLYDYCVVRLTQANVENNPAKIDEVTALIEPVASGWKQIRSQVLRGGAK